MPPLCVLVRAAAAPDRLVQVPDLHVVGWEPPSMVLCGSLPLPGGSLGCLGDLLSGPIVLGLRGVVQGLFGDTEWAY